MNRTNIALLAVLLLAVGTFGCSSGDDEAKDCATALTARTGGRSDDKPTVEEAKARVDAFDKTLASMARSGSQGLASDAFDAMADKAKEGGETRPDACKPLSEDDYTVLQMAKSIDGLGWTDKDGQFDKLKMAQGLGN
jgi:alcohol dehydrogenase class IV